MGDEARKKGCGFAGCTTRIALRPRTEQLWEADKIYVGVEAAETTKTYTGKKRPVKRNTFGGKEPIN